MIVHDLPRTTSKVIKWNNDWVIVPLSCCLTLASKSYDTENIVQYKTLLPTQNISPEKCGRAILEVRGNQPISFYISLLHASPHARYWNIEMKHFQSGLFTVLKIIQILTHFK